MRRKLVEQTPPPKCRKKGWWTIVQDIEGITVLNIFSDGGLKTRHCIDMEGILITKAILTITGYPHGSTCIRWG